MIHTAMEGSEEPSPELLYAAGHWLFEAERYADAATLFRLLAVTKPNDERAWVALGECHERVGHQRVALEMYGVGMVEAEPAPRCALGRARLLNNLGEDAGDAFAVARECILQADADELLPILEACERMEH
ncbi:MAG: tetratricopeptide repeat protein [Polyangiaceae bacterium]